MTPVLEFSGPPGRDLRMSNQLRYEVEVEHGLKELGNFPEPAVCSDLLKMRLCEAQPVSCVIAVRALKQIPLSMPYPLVRKNGLAIAAGLLFDPNRVPPFHIVVRVVT